MRFRAHGMPAYTAYIPMQGEICTATAFEAHPECTVEITTDLRREGLDRISAN